MRLQHSVIALFNFSFILFQSHQIAFIIRLKYKNFLMRLTKFSPSIKKTVSSIDFLSAFAVISNISSSVHFKSFIFFMTIKSFHKKILRTQVKNFYRQPKLHGNNWLLNKVFYFIIIFILIFLTDSI